VFNYFDSDGTPGMSLQGKNWHCVEHLEPDWNGSACPAQAQILIF